MGEIDTKPIESVQSALSLFGEKKEQRKYRVTGSEESEKEKEFELMLKDVAHYKVQLEAKEFDYKQALLKLASYRQTVDELSQQLKDTAAERDRLIGCCREARSQIDGLESKVKEMSDMVLEAEVVGEQLLHAVNELKITQEELFNAKTELSAMEESNFAAMTQVEAMSIAVNMEKEKTEDLLKFVSDLNETIFLSKLATIEAEKENSTILSQKDTEIEMATAAAAEAQEKLDVITDQVNVMQEMENQLMEKTLLIDSLRSELKKVKEFHDSLQKAASDDNNDVKQIRTELELMERVNSDQSIHIQSKETEMKQLQSDFENVKEEVIHLNHGIELLTCEIQKAKTEMDEIRARESEAQIEIALLKSELHIGRSKIAAAEGAEASAKSVKSGLYLAVKELAIEADKAKKETQSLKQEMVKAEAEEEKEDEKPKVEEKEEDTGSFTFVNPHVEECVHLDMPQIEKSKSLLEVKGDNNDAHITITMREYESLILKAEKADQVALVPPEVASQAFESGSSHVLNALQKELEVAMAEIWKLRSVAEEAVGRAEMAERAKTAIEDQLRKWREHQQKRRVALAALREESAPQKSIPPKYAKPAKYDNTPVTYQPLSKVLDMKF